MSPIFAATAAATNLQAPRQARPSPLNPNSRTNPNAKPNTNLSTTTTTKTHLANLDRLLARPQPLPHPAKSGAFSDSGVANARSGNGNAGLLNALNLSSLLPFLRKPAADEMSPRSLTHLQRLLSASPRPSPKNSISSAWRAYHGADAWGGLLDPLDENLRRELVRYGDFVQAAYTAFHSMPSPPPTSPQPHRGLLLPDRAYRHTRNLFATSSLSIPSWAERPSAPRWLTQQSSFVGYVAVCDSEREVIRMGRRDIVIVLRGTATCPEWAENLRTSLVPLTDHVTDDGAHVPRVARGFLSLYKTDGEHVPSLSTAIVDEVQRLVELYKGEKLSITVVGHSLGAALALLAADELSTCGFPDMPPIAVVSFGGPKTGNRAFAERLERDGVKVNVLRVVNAGDVVTRVPGFAPHVREGYVHVGAELRLESRDSPCLRPDAGPACCHDLEAYLHLLDGFIGPGRPFRPDASRSVARLLQHQRPNVKKVYVERARVLGFEPAATAAALAGPDQCGYVASPS